MRKLKIMVILLGVVGITIFSCKKEDETNRSDALTLLQNNWTPIAIWIYFPDGNEYQLLPSISVSFNSDGKVVVPYYVTDPSLPYPYLKLEYLIRGYQLLPDDSTLLFYQIVDGVQNTVVDTATISTLTNHLLVYYHKKQNFIVTIDSLKR